MIVKLTVQPKDGKNPLSVSMTGAIQSIQIPRSPGEYCSFSFVIKDIDGSIEDLHRIMLGLGSDSKPKSDLELVKLLKKQFVKEFREGKKIGLCLRIQDMCKTGILTSDESGRLRRILVDNRPKISLYSDFYWWPINDIKSRLKFLKKLKKKYKKTKKTESREYRLLKLLSDELDRDHWLNTLTGLCNCISKLVNSDKISSNDGVLLRTLIKELKPPFADNFWFPKGHYNQRRELVNMLLKKYKSK